LETYFPWLGIGGFLPGLNYQVYWTNWASLAKNSYFGIRRKGFIIRIL